LLRKLPLNGIGQTFASVHDSERRLKSVSANAAPMASYSHDGLGRRVRKALPDGTHRKYVYDLDGRIIAERDEQNQPVRETIFVDGHPVAEMVGAPGSTTIRYIHTDHVGLPRLMTDGSGAVIWDSAFMPFGEQVSATGSTSTDHRFQGQLADTHASLSYNYFRDYDPTLGRYIQSDPIGLDGGLNRVSYVDGNPLQYADPYGLNRRSAGPTAPSTTAGILRGVQARALRQEIARLNPNRDTSSVSRPGSEVSEAELTYLRGVLQQEQDSRSCRFDPEQQALIELAKAAKRRGVTRDEGDTLVEWAREHGLEGRGPESHPGRPYGQNPHYHVGPVKHIPLK
jgi:RHS repeat-associated protein